MNINLHPAAIHLFKFAAQSGIGKHAIENVLVESWRSDSMRMYRAVATNGHCLAEVVWQADEDQGAQELPEPILLKADDLKALSKISGKNHAILEKTDTGVWLAWVGFTSVTIRANTEATYPDWRAVIDPAKGQGGSRALNPTYVAECMNHAKKTINKNFVRLRMDLGGDGGAVGPVRVDAEGMGKDISTAARYIIMSMRA